MISCLSQVTLTPPTTSPESIVKNMRPNNQHTISTPLHTLVIRKQLADIGPARTHRYRQSWSSFFPHTLLRPIQRIHVRSPSPTLFARCSCLKDDSGAPSGGKIIRGRYMADHLPCFSPSSPFHSLFLLFLEMTAQQADMWHLPLCIAFFLLSLVSAITLPTSPANSTCNQQCHIDKILGPELSQHASIVHTTSAVPRWSDFDAPNPGTVVNVASEHDVLLTVGFSPNCSTRCSDSDVHDALGPVLRCTQTKWTRPLGHLTISLMQEAVVSA